VRLIIFGEFACSTPILSPRSHSHGVSCVNYCTWKLSLEVKFIWP
jgi:hypothetical protein